MPPDLTILSAVFQGAPWAAVAAVLAWAVVVMVDGKTGMRAVRTELREVRVQLDRERERADRLERAALRGDDR